MGSTLPGTAAVFLSLPVRVLASNQPSMTESTEHLETPHVAMYALKTLAMSRPCAETFVGKVSTLSACLVRLRIAENSRHLASIAL